jgi:hypothetical protein
LFDTAITAIPAEQALRVFFFEKKNQKTFIPCGVIHRHSACKDNKSLLLLFFRKEGLALSPHAIGGP